MVFHACSLRGLLDGVLAREEDAKGRENSKSGREAIQVLGHIMFKHGSAGRSRWPCQRGLSENRAAPVESPRQSHPALVKMPLWPQADLLAVAPAVDWRARSPLKKLGKHGVAALGLMLEMSPARSGLPKPSRTFLRSASNFSGALGPKPRTTCL